MNMNIINQHAQKGALLIVSMMLLFVLTLLGVTSVSTSSLEGRMATNFQHKTILFQIVESALSDALIMGDPDITTNPNYDAANDLMITALSKGVGDLTTALTDNSQKFNTIRNTTVNTNTLIVLMAQSPCGGASFSSGGSGGIICYAYEFRSTATHNSTNTNETHIQGVERTGPGY